jgi:aryl-phospho-beta-D-glucosidase BglC (GH1 family)
MMRLAIVAAWLLTVGMRVSAQDGIDRSLPESEAWHSAMQVINDMSPGWNLGNTLEAKNGNGADFLNNKGGLESETAWQPTKTTQQVIDYVKSLGFRSVRIPCAWACGHISNAQTYEIDAQWMARVKEVVDYCIRDSLYVVLNDHWDGGWLEEHIKDSDAATIKRNKEVLTALWTQIATAFRDYDEHLLFAGLNEPRADTQAATDNLIQYNQTFVDAVRATGGNNLKRVLVVQGPTTNIEHTCNFMAGRMPTDVVADRLAIEVHYYHPWQFWGMEKDESWGNVVYYWGKGNHLSGSTRNATTGEEDNMRELLMRMKTTFVDKGYPVVIGEFGANWRDLSALPGESQEKHNASIKAHYREMHRLCKELGGMVPMTWDTNYCQQDGTKGRMTLIDRKNLTVFGTYAMEGINEIYPSQSASAIRDIVQPCSEQSQAVYRLDGRKVNGEPLSPGFYIRQGKKFVKI